MNSDEWLTIIRRNLQNENAPLTLSNGRWWGIKNRLDLWERLGTSIFDAQLDIFKECAIEVLTEIDPQFELPPEKRYAASIHGKVLKHSKELRKGLAETLALLGTNSGALKNCSNQKAENISILAIREIFKDADWRLWGSINNLLPILAEAAPGEFIGAIENSLKANPCPFDELFSQEDESLFGQSYMTGLLWALESLAWHEEYIGSASLVLAELATHDPGGNWTNRPINSLITMLLPWLPQTKASIEKQVACLKAIKADFPNMAWKIALSLLPNQHQSSSGTNKPKWRDPLPDDFEIKISTKDYWNQVNSYADIAVELATDDVSKLMELVRNLNNLPRKSVEITLQHLSADTIVGLNEKERLPIWTSLVDFVVKHRRFSDAKWAVDEDLLVKIEMVVKKLEPISFQGINQRIFRKADFGLYEKNDDWKTQKALLEEKQKKVISNIIENDGFNGILSFANNVESPWKVGMALGSIENNNVDDQLLPKYLTSNNDSLQELASSFVSERYCHQGWKWVDSINFEKWKAEQINKFLLALPFTDKTWKMAEDLLKANVDEYWKIAFINSSKDDFDISFVVDKLLKVKRANSAIDYLFDSQYEEVPFNQEMTVRALLQAVKESNSTSSESDPYHITELIKKLQNEPGVSEDDLCEVEWAYLPILNLYDSDDTFPITLNRKLSNNPDFFCEIIRLVYRSTYEDENQQNEQDVDEHRRNLARNGDRLLEGWNVPPGLDSEGNFSKKQFKSWLKNVIKKCGETGHLEMALHNIGEVLFHTPADKDGFWINKTVAESLNNKNYSEMRSGYSVKVFNSRGVYSVDLTGKPEKDLATEWLGKAELVENEGFTRFATTLREVANSYTRDAERIIAEHGGNIIEGE